LWYTLLYTQEAAAALEAAGPVDRDIAGEDYELLTDAIVQRRKQLQLQRRKAARASAHRTESGSSSYVVGGSSATAAATAHGSAAPWTSAAAARAAAAAAAAARMTASIKNSVKRPVQVQKHLQVMTRLHAAC
jgi:hypothetical protein